MGLKKHILLYDLETDSTNAEVAYPRIMGYYTSQVEGFFWTTNISEMKRIIADHDYIVGWNNNEYDDAIMRLFGVNFYGKVIIDLMEILHGKGFGSDKGRKNIIDIHGENLGKMLHTKKLDDAGDKILGMQKIQDHDYNLYKIAYDDNTTKDQQIILEYLKRDLDITKGIYEFMEDYFEDFRVGGMEIDGTFKKYLTEVQVIKKQYLTSSIASFAYKALCNLAGIREEYGDAEPESYGGGFVAFPSSETYTGNIYCLDYSSLYPHIMMMANLYGNTLNGWKGEGISFTKGTYNSVSLAPVGSVLQQLYQRRLEYKKVKDERQYTIKILINTIYGLLGNPAFKNVCNFTAAADCTRLGRQWVQYSRKHFMENGYEVIYTDTDSVYLRDPYNDKARMLSVRDEQIKYIKGTVPFPQDTFDMTIDDEIKFITFFKGSDGNFLKKNYLYVTNGGKMVIKGMQIVKSNCSPLGLHIFDKFIKEGILLHSRHKSTRSQINKWVYQEVEANPALSTVFYKVKKPSEYKNESQLQRQFALKWGEGAYNVVKTLQPHSKGAGRFKNYIRVEDLGDTPISMLDLTKTMKELEPFTDTPQSTLDEWFK